MPRPCSEWMFSPWQGSGSLAGSKPEQGSRTTIMRPRASSQATSHSITLEGPLFAPCTTELARASVNASSMSSSLPGAHSVSRTTVIMLRTTSSTAPRSAESVTLSLRPSLFASGLQDCGGCGARSEDGVESAINWLWTVRPFTQPFHLTRMQKLECRNWDAAKTPTDSRDLRAEMQTLFGSQATL